MEANAAAKFVSKLHNVLGQLSKAAPVKHTRSFRGYPVLAVGSFKAVVRIGSSGDVLVLKSPAGESSHEIDSAGKISPELNSAIRNFYSKHKDHTSHFA